MISTQFLKLNKKLFHYLTTDHMKGWSHDLVFNILLYLGEYTQTHSYTHANSHTRTHAQLFVFWNLIAFALVGFPTFDSDTCYIYLWLVDRCTASSSWPVDSLVHLLTADIPLRLDVGCYDITDSPDDWWTDNVSSSAYASLSFVTTDVSLTHRCESLFGFNSDDSWDL